MSRVLSLWVSGLVIAVIVGGARQTALARGPGGGQSQMMHRHHHHHHRHPMPGNGQMGGQMMNQVGGQMMNQRMANGGKPAVKPAVAKRAAKK